MQGGGDHAAHPYLLGKEARQGVYIIVQQAFFTIKEICQQENLPESEINHMMSDPRFAALRLTENGTTLIAANAVNSLLESRHETLIPPKRFSEAPHWDWNLPDVKTLRRSDLQKLFGISRATSYSLFKYDGFPCADFSTTRLYVRTDALKEWLDNRAIIFHSVYRERRKKNVK